MVDLYTEIDFTKEIKETPELETFLKAKAQEAQEELSSDYIKKPFLERQFNQYLIGNLNSPFISYQVMRQRNINKDEKTHDIYQKENQFINIEIILHYQLVTGLPNTEASKAEQFKQFFRNKILQSVGILDKISDIEFQLDTSGNFQGITIIKFITEEEANEGLNKLHGLRFMKYELSAYSLYSFQQVLDAPDTFAAPVNLPKRELLEWSSESRKSLLTMQIGDKVYNYWTSHLESDLENYLAKPSEEVAEADQHIRLTSEQSDIQWSKNGSYMVEFNAEGFQLYGGKELKKLSFFPHKSVKNIEFSPCENYILSYNGTIVVAPDEDNFIVWHIGEVKKLRVFKALQQDIWATFKWCHDGKYIGRISDHKLSVFELPQMNMINDQQGNATSINVRNVQKFYWCNKQNIIVGCSYLGNHREHDKQVSTRIAMFEIPNRREIKWRTISNESSDIDIIPSVNGNFVIAIIKKIKSKKVVSYTIQVANIRNRGQMDISEHEINDKVHTYSVDPYQGRLGFVYKTEEQRGESSTMVFHSQIFHIEEESKSFAIKDAGRFNNKNTKEIMFSHSSGFFALINKDINSAHCGIMECGFTRKDKGKLVSDITRTYNNLSYIDNASYDQSGRFIVVSSQRTKSFYIFTAYGEQIYKDTITDPVGIKNIIWRPRLTNLLDEKTESSIQSNYKDYKKGYEDEDFKITNKKEWERRERREKLKKEFSEYLTIKRKEWKDTKAERVALLGYDEDDETDLVYDEFIENERVVKTETIEEVDEDEIN